MFLKLSVCIPLTLARAAVVLATVVPGSLRAQSSREIEQLLANRRVVEHAIELSQPISYSVFADGSIALLEFQSFQVVRLSELGAVLWTYGRRGDGPGEFKAPYRVLVMPDQSVLVFDIGNFRVTRLTADGKYLDERRPDMPVNMFNVIVLPSGEIAMSGITRDPRGVGSSIHLFSDKLQHIRSFGLLPEDASPQFLKASHAGGLTTNDKGDLLHTRPWPYELMRYNRSGQLLGRAAVRITVDPPDASIRVSQGSGQTTFKTNPAAVRPIPLVQISADRFLGGRLTAQRSHIDLIDSTGRVVSTTVAPRDWSSIAVLDRAKSTLWVYGEPVDVPALIQYKLPAQSRR